jgi:hypothetical protein
MIDQIQQRIHCRAEIIHLGPGAALLDGMPAITPKRCLVQPSRGDQQVIFRQFPGKDPHRIFIPRPAVQQQDHRVRSYSRRFADAESPIL